MGKIDTLNIYIIGGPAEELAKKWNMILQNVIDHNKINMYKNVGIDTNFLIQYAERIKIIGMTEGQIIDNSFVTDTGDFVYGKDINGIVLLSDAIYPKEEQEKGSSAIYNENIMRLSHVAARLIPLIRQHQVVFLGYNGTKTLERLEEIIKDYMTEENNPCFYSNRNRPQKNLLINPQVSSMRAFAFLLNNIVKEIMTCNEYFGLKNPNTELEYADTSEIEAGLKKPI